MEIIGRGLIARTLASREASGTGARRCADERRADICPFPPDTLVFATGVGDSGCSDPHEYLRELDMLDDTLQRCAAENRRLVYFSSAGRIYGETCEPRDESTPVAPGTEYGRHKRECEALIRRYPGRHLILRLANLVGPRQNPQQLVPQLVEQVLRGEVTVYEHATRDLLGVDRFTEVLAELLQNAQPRETLVVATGISLPIAAIVGLIEETLHVRAARRPIDSGDPQEFHIAKLRALAPTTSRFAPDYPAQMLRAHIGPLAELMKPRSPPTSRIPQ